jgi:acyl-CoA hydrolase
MPSHVSDPNNESSIQGAAATPRLLIDALVDAAPRLEDVELIHLHTFGPARYADPQLAKSLRVANLFVGPNLRGRFDEDRVDDIPCFLSEIPRLFRSRWRPLHHAVESDEPLYEVPAPKLSDEERAIGRIVAGLIDDGSTLQAGIGAVPDAILQALSSHRHLGLHTEMWSDGALALLRSGAIDNSNKAIHPGRSGPRCD